MSSSSTKATPPPPPMDDPSISDPLSCPPLRWGILGCGRVSNDFVQALKLLPTQTVVAVAARKKENAEGFASKHGVATAYGSYEELYQNPEIQIIYVGNVHAFRKPIGTAILNANKHVLLEKPFALCYDDAQYLINLAKEKKRFIMEGMWTRFFPAVEQARRWIGGEDGKGGVIGEVVSVQTDFSFNAADGDDYPGSILYNHKMGGGATYFTGPYTMQYCTLAFQGRSPDRITAVGQVDEGTGVDLQVSASLSYAPTSTVPPALDEENTEENTVKLPGAGIASMTYGMLGEAFETTSIIGTKGRILIHTPSHCPTSLTLYLKNTGRGNVEPTTCTYPLPPDTEAITKSGGYVYPNSAGFAYEAAAVARCVEKGWLEVPQFGWGDVLGSVKVLDEVKRQLGVKPVELEA